MAVKGKEEKKERKRGASRDDKRKEVGKERNEYEVKNTFRDRTKKEVAAWVAQGGERGRSRRKELQ